MKRSLPAFVMAASAAFALLSATPRVLRADDAAKRHGPIAWTESLAAASKTAAKDKKVIFVDFWAEWCGPCKQMLATTYKDKIVVEKSKAFVPVLINVDKDPEPAKKYKVEAIPTVIFLDSKGSVLERSTGALPADKFLKLMESAQKKLKS